MRFSRDSDRAASLAHGNHLHQRCVTLAERQRVVRPALQRAALVVGHLRQRVDRGIEPLHHARSRKGHERLARRQINLDTHAVRRVSRLAGWHTPCARIRAAPTQPYQQSHQQHTREKRQAFFHRHSCLPRVSRIRASSQFK
jgi:hypothetical protein